MEQNLKGPNSLHDKALDPLILLVGCEALGQSYLSNVKWPTAMCMTTSLQRQRCIRVGKKGKKEEAYVRQVLNRFNSTPEIPRGDNSQGNQKRSLRAAIAVCYNYYVQLVATKRI